VWSVTGICCLAVAFPVMPVLRPSFRWLVTNARDVKKSSQIQSVNASAPAIPEWVGMAMAEIAENMREGLLALAVGAGLQVMAALMEADVSALAGP
jgi:hypothetical protein